MQKDLKDLFGNDHGLDEKSVGFLTKALEKNNLPGFDYLEFKLSLVALSKMQMDEITAIRSAFATASTMGLTKEKLLKTADHYRKVIIQEKSQFEMAMNNQIQQKIGGKQQEVEKLKVQIEKHREKILQLQDQINKYQATVDGADAQMAEARQKIESTREGFELTHQSILNQIDRDIENMKNNL
ncbi:MAG: hypothetical protein AAFV95_07980 [Bacteroidota bacterium]